MSRYRLRFLVVLAALSYIALLVYRTSDSNDLLRSPQSAIDRAQLYAFFIAIGENEVLKRNSLGPAAANLEHKGSPNDGTYVICQKFSRSKPNGRARYCTAYGTFTLASIGAFVRT